MQVLGNGFNATKIKVLAQFANGEQLWMYEAMFNGDTYVHLRKVYEQGGKWNPGKQGISVRNGDIATLNVALSQLAMVS